MKKSDYNWEEEFDKIFKCQCILCVEKQHQFTTTADYMKDFIRKVIQKESWEQSCSGCGHHDSMWKTLVQSKEWSAWLKYQEKTVRMIPMRLKS
jgi:hypothetical protein